MVLAHLEKVHSLTTKVHFVPFSKTTGIGHNQKYVYWNLFAGSSVAVIAFQLCVDPLPCPSSCIFTDWMTFVPQTSSVKMAVNEQCEAWQRCLCFIVGSHGICFYSSLESTSTTSGTETVHWLLAASDKNIRWCLAIASLDNLARRTVLIPVVLSQQSYPACQQRLATFSIISITIIFRNNKYTRTCRSLSITYEYCTLSVMLEPCDIFLECSFVCLTFVIRCTYFSRAVDPLDLWYGEWRLVEGGLCWWCVRNDALLDVTASCFSETLAQTFSIADSISSCCDVELSALS